MRPQKSLTQPSKWYTKGCAVAAKNPPSPDSQSRVQNQTPKPCQLCKHDLPIPMQLQSLCMYQISHSTALLNFSSVAHFPDDAVIQMDRRAETPFSIAVAHDTMLIQSPEPQASRDQKSLTTKQKTGRRFQAQSSSPGKSKSVQSSSSRSWEVLSHRIDLPDSDLLLVVS